MALGPDLVYPMLSIGTRQSGRLAKLILEHCKTAPQYKFQAARPFPRGIDPPRVAVVDLNEVSQEVIAKGYSTQLDFHGLIWMLILFMTTITFVVEVFFPPDWGPATAYNWIIYALSSAMFCLGAVLAGDSTLTLACRSDMSTPGCAILRDQDFTVVLSGNQNIVEAIAESGFNLSHSGLMWNPKSTRRYRLRAYSLETLCETACLTFLELFFLLLFRPSTVKWFLSLFAVIFIAALLLQMFPANQISLSRRAWFAITELPYLLSPLYYFS